MSAPCAAAATATQVPYLVALFADPRAAKAGADGAAQQGGEVRVSWAARWLAGTAPPHASPLRLPLSTVSRRLAGCESRSQPAHVSPCPALFVSLHCSWPSSRTLVP
jgi:hypothetical protein